MALAPCPTCRRHVRPTTRCPWCAAALPALGALLLGLGGCPTVVQPMYGVAPSDHVEERSGETGGPDCSAYEYQGATYDCGALDRCTEEDTRYRLACCDCDPALCDLPTTCDTGTP